MKFNYAMRFTTNEICALIEAEVLYNNFYIICILLNSQ